MPELFQDVLAYVKELKGQYAARNKQDDALEMMYLLEWDEEAEYKKRMKNVAITKSPDARNALLGAVRLLSHQGVKFSVPFEENDTASQQQSSPIEKFAAGVWRAASRVRSNPLEADVALSTLLFGETHILVTKTADMVEWASKGTPAAKAKAEAIAAATPFVFDVVDPRTGYPDMDAYGLTAYYREVEVTVGSVVDQFGAKAQAQFPTASRYARTTLCSLWDFNRHRVWVQGRDVQANQFLLDEENTLPFIPVVVQLGEGSMLFDEPEYQRQPFLYTLYKSGFWNRQNQMYTVGFTAWRALGSNPMYKANLSNKEDPLVVDKSVMGGVLKMNVQESIEPLMTQVLDPSLTPLIEMTERKGQESTIFGQALGEPLGGNAPYSMVALLHQAGRLPLAVPQQKSQWAIADALKLALKWLKHDKVKGKVTAAGKTWELAHQDVPDTFELEAILDTSLSMEKLQMANVVQMLQGIVSNRYLRESVLSIGQSDEMQEEIWSEQMADLAAQTAMQELLAVLKAAQNPQPEMGANGLPPGTPQPGGAPPSVPPEMMQGGGAPLEQVPGENTNNGGMPSE